MARTCTISRYAYFLANSSGLHISLTDVIVGWALCPCTANPIFTTDSCDRLRARFFEVERNCWQYQWSHQQKNPSTMKKLSSTQPPFNQKHATTGPSNTKEAKRRKPTTLKNRKSSARVRPQVSFKPSRYCSSRARLITNALIRLGCRWSFRHTNSRQHRKVRHASLSHTHVQVREQVIAGVLAVYWSYTYADEAPRVFRWVKAKKTYVHSCTVWKV